MLLFRWNAKGLEPVVALLFFLRFSECSEEVWNNNHRLREELLRNYDKKALPEKEANGTTTVLVDLIVRGIWIEDDTQILVVNCWLPLMWADHRLKWDYKDYGGLNKAHFGDDELWKPDITTYNNAAVTEVDHFGNVHFLVYSDGNVMWVPPAQFKVNCHMDLKLWPYDQQQCYVILGSWTSHGWQVNLELYHNNTKIQTSLLDTSNNWKVLSGEKYRVTTYYPCCPEPYIEIHFRFLLKRESPTFNCIVVVPAVVIPIFLMLQFVLPVDHPRRLSIGCCSSVLILLELLFLKSSLPKLGTSVPLIVRYYSQSFVLVVVTVGISAILGRLAHPQNPIVALAPPELLKMALKGIPASLLCLRHHADKVGLSDKGAEDGEVLENTTPSYSHEWLFIAKATDRISVIILIGIYICSLIGYVSPIKQ